MVKTHLSFWMSACLILVIFGMTSCTQDETEALEETVLQNEATAFENESVFTLQRGSSSGRNGCYELIFPLSIAFEDGTVVEVNSHRELRQNIRQWKQDNPDSTTKPEFVFPIELLNEEGEMLTVNTAEELEELRADCPGRFGNGHNGPKCGQRCFELVFPVTINFPDGTSEAFDEKIDMKQAIKTWFEANGRDGETRPELDFPVDVILEDETTITINTKEELQELKQSCKTDN